MSEFAKRRTKGEKTSEESMIELNLSGWMGLGTGLRVYVFRVQDLGFRGLGFRGLGIRVEGFSHSGLGLGSRG